MSVIVTGTLGFDYIMDFPGKFADRIMPDKIHKISLGFLVDKLTRHFGGTAGNIAYTLSLLKINPVTLSTAGKDFSPYKKFLEKRKIATNDIIVHKNDVTGSYFVITDKEDNQIGSFYLGATRYTSDLSISKVLKTNKIDFAVLAPTQKTAMVKFVRECIKEKIPFLFDPAFQIDEFLPEELLLGIKSAKILIGNDYEISLVEKKLKVTHKDLLKMGPVVVTTLGDKGSLIETPKEKIVVKSAKPENTSDPTGAGDAYRAGFLSGYLRGFPLQVCGQMGSVAAAYTVEKYGTMTHNFTIMDFAKRYKENFNEDLRGL